VSYSMGRCASSAAVASEMLDVDIVADVGHSAAADQVFDLADKIDGCVLGAAALGQGHLTARNLDNDGNKILCAIQLEVIDLHGNGEFGDGVFEHQRVFQLPQFCRPQ
jgi:hypothetical protein